MMELSTNKRFDPLKYVLVFFERQDFEQRIVFPRCKQKKRISILHENDG